MPPPASPSPDAQTLRTVEALGSMTDVMRLILLLRVYDGWRCWEISHMTGYNINIIRSLEERGFLAAERTLGRTLDRDTLRRYIRDAFQRMIDDFHPDIVVVARIRADLLERIGRGP